MALKIGDIIETACKPCIEGTLQYVHQANRHVVNVVSEQAFSNEWCDLCCEDVHQGQVVMRIIHRAND